MKTTSVVSLLIAAITFFGLAESAKADVVKLPVDTDFFFFVFLMIVVVIIALILVIEMKRRTERKKHITPSSKESEDISKF